MVVKEPSTQICVGSFGLSQDFRQSEVLTQGPGLSMDAGTFDVGNFINVLPRAHHAIWGKNTMDTSFSHVTRFQTFHKAIVTYENYKLDFEIVTQYFHNSFLLASSNKACCENQ